MTKRRKKSVRKDDHESPNPYTEALTNPYFFQPLYTAVRQILHLIGRHSQDVVSGSQLLTFTTDHDTLRRIVSWNFLEPVRTTEALEYEERVWVDDWELGYRITEQAREFIKLELNNISDLNRAILLLLRADYHAERPMGVIRVAIRSIGFYELVMILNKSESAIMTALRLLESMGLVVMKLIFTEDGRVWGLGSEITITNSGMLFVEHNGDRAMAFNNINIVNSNVGVVALQSTLTNIDATVGNIKEQGNVEIANALSGLTERITASALSDEHKREVLEQIELIGGQAEASAGERKIPIVKGAMAFLERALTAATGLATVWTTFGPAIKKFFGL